MKVLIFDSGTLINLSMNGLLYVLEDLKKTFQGKFIITEEVKYEVIDRPCKVPRFELGALRIDTLLSKKVLELPSSLNISDHDLKKRTNYLMKKVNGLIQSKHRKIDIVSSAEISCLALSSLLSKKGISNIIAIDERTTRILTENPRNLQKIMSKKLHQYVELKQADFSEFKNYKFIRSSEIVYVAHKKGLLKVKGKKALEAVLYATKYKGASISHDEIKELKKL